MAGINFSLCFLDICFVSLLDLWRAGFLDWRGARAKRTVGIQLMKNHISE